MNITKRLARLSVDDLEDLQTAILWEIQQRKEIEASQLPPLMAMMRCRQELSDAAKTTVPATVRPSVQRRAA